MLPSRPDKRPAARCESTIETRIGRSISLRKVVDADAAAAVPAELVVAEVEGKAEEDEAEEAEEEAEEAEGAVAVMLSRVDLSCTRTICFCSSTFVAPSGPRVRCA